MRLTPDADYSNEEQDERRNPIVGVATMTNDKCRMTKEGQKKNDKQAPSIAPWSFDHSGFIRH
jgi:hypothetical protein